MAEYTPNKLLVATGLDEIGMKLGLQRLPDETMGEYRKRLYLEAMDPSGPTQKDFIRTIGRKVGQFDVPFLEVELAMSGGNPLAADPYIEVTSSYFRAYSDYDGGVVEVELDLTNRTAGYFLRDIEDALDASSYFTVTILDDDYTYRKSSQLRFCNSEAFQFSEALSTSRENKLQYSNVRNVWFTDPLVFQSLQAGVGAISELGDYYVDLVNGVVFSREPARGFVSYCYRAFPFKLFWQPVRVWPLMDSDSDRLRYDSLISDETGEVEYTSLNSLGAEITEEVLAVHPLGWGR